jgi:site-specific DNA recombinase
MVTRPDPTRVALYARVSSEEQAEAETIEVQRDFLHRYAELHGKEVAAEYLDDGVSGTIPLEKRPQGVRMLAHAREGRFGEVLFMRVSRLGRRLGVVLDAYEALDGAGVVVKSGTEPIDTSTPIGRFIFQMLGSFAELDRETIIDNTTRGRARGARNGRWYGAVPTGYTVSDGRLTPNEAEILPGLTEANLMRDIFRRVADGESSTQVALYVGALGVDRFRRYARHDGREVIVPGAPGWRPARVSEMIRNPTYKGVHVYNGRDGDIAREVPALVSEELWQRANDRLTENRTASKRNIKNDYMLRLLIRCTLCGGRYHGMASQSARVYRCTNSSSAVHPDPSQRCRAKGIGADRLERAVWQDCERFLRDPGSALDDARRQLEVRREQVVDITGQRQQLLGRIAGKDQERGDILALLRRGTIRIDEAEQQLEAIAAE